MQHVGVRWSLEWPRMTLPDSHPIPILCGINYDVQVQRIDYDDC